MNKKLITLAVLAGMAAPSAAMAELTPYARIHLSMDSFDDAQNGYGTNAFGDLVDDEVTAGTITATEGAQIKRAIGKTGSPAEDLEMNSRKSVFGIKGSEDIGGGNKIFYKVEWEVKPDEGDDNFIDRDQYLGIKFGQGSVKVGTMTNNYKASGMKLDVLKHTAIEARGFLNIQSAAHRGRGINGGRSTNTVQYTSPKMGGMQLVVNRTFEGNTQAASAPANSSSTEETLGVGFRAGGKTWSAAFDYIDMVCNNTGIAGCTTDGTESGFKVGGKVKLGKSFSVAGQFEDVADIKTKGTILENSDIGEYLFLQGIWKMSSNNSVVLSYGAEGDISTGTALAFVHKTGGKSKVYIGYGDRSDDIDGSSGAEATANEQSVITAGWSASFK